MENTLRTGKFSIDGEDLAVVDGWTKDTYWNGWANIWLTLPSLQKWLYNFGNVPYTLHPSGVVTLTLEGCDEESLSPVVIDGMTLYSMNGYCFQEVAESPVCLSCGKPAVTNELCQDCNKTWLKFCAYVGADPAE